MAKIKITKIKSTIARKPAHRAIMEALGLRKIGQHVIHEANPAIMGMVAKVSYLVKVEDYSEPEEVAGK